MQRGMKVLTGDARAGQRRQVGDDAALVVQPRQLDDHGPLPRHRVLPDLARLDRPEVRRSGRVRMRHLPTLQRARREIAREAPASG